jgi:hypothetical protein
MIFGIFLKMLALSAVAFLGRDLLAFLVGRSLAMDCLSVCLRLCFGIVNLYSEFVLTLLKYYVLLYANVEVLSTKTTSKSKQQPKALVSSKQF